MSFVLGTRLKSVLSVSLLGAILAGLLFAECSVSGAGPGWWRSIAVEVQAACRDAGTQWMVVVCLVSYFITFLFLERRLRPSTPHPGPLPGRGGEGDGTSCPQPSTFNFMHWLELGFYAGAAALCGLGLIKSYSRGAWLGATVGIGYLIWVATKVRGGRGQGSGQANAERGMQNAEKSSNECSAKNAECGVQKGAWESWKAENGKRKLQRIRAVRVIRGFLCG